MPRALCLLLSLGLMTPAPLFGQPAASDADVAKGIQLVEDGDYDGAILTLDNAARRLSQDPKRARDLSQAYLYLGIAYLGKGHEAAAKAKFREAVAQVRDLSLSPEKFPPKVINMFEAAKDEARAAPSVPSASAPGRSAATETKKGGSKKGLVLVGLGAAAAGGAALALGGGDGGGNSPPPDDRRTEPFSGSLTENEYSRHFFIVVASAGTLEATVSWTSTGGDRPAVLQLDLYDRNGENLLASGNRTTNTSGALTANVTAREYKVDLYHRESCNGCVATFNLSVRHP